MFESDMHYICDYLGLPSRELLEDHDVLEVMFLSFKWRCVYNPKPYPGNVYAWGTDLLYGLVRAMYLNQSDNRYG